MAGRRGLLEELDRTAVVTRRARQALRVDQRQPVRAFARAGIGGVLDAAQSFAVGSAVEQHRAVPGFGVGVAGGEGAKRGLGGGEIAGAIGRDRGAQRRRDVVGIDLLAARNTAGGEQRREQRHPQRDHFVLKV